MTVRLRTRDRMPGFNKAVKELARQQVMVGIPADKTARKAGDKEPLNNAQIGYIMEHGSPAANIPARPWLNPGVKSVEEKTTARLSKTAETALSSGDPTLVIKGLMAVGLTAQSGVRGYITTNAFLPLAPATLAARRRRGRTGEKPLIDTGQLRAAVNFVIRPRGG